MEEGVSGYLDAIRVIAALEVFMAHLGDKFGAGWATIFVPYAHQAVIVFFVLSGYMIAYVSAERELSLSRFAIGRGSRIYSIVIPALVLTAIIDIFLLWIRVDMSTRYQLVQPWKYGPLFLSFGTDWWFLNEDALSDAPYWSLCYEVWYYVLFALWFYLAGRKRLFLCGAVLLLVGPRSWLLLPIWLAGVWLYHLRSRVLWPWAIARRIWAATVVALTVLLLTGWYTAPTHAFYQMIGAKYRDILRYSQYFIGDYMIAALLVVNIAAAARCRFRFGRFLPWIRYAAGLTFALYLMHYPLLQLYSQWLTSWRLAVAVLGSVWLMGKPTERFRMALRYLMITLASVAPQVWARAMDQRHG